MQTKTSILSKIWIALLLVIASWVITAVLYSQLPDPMISHWNAQGNPDGFMDKSTAAWLMPVIGVLLFALIRVIPYIDPLKKNIKMFLDVYYNFAIIFFGFFLYIQAMILAANLGMAFNFSLILAPAIAVMLFYAGYLCRRARRNFFIGIRTPWTLSSDVVWRKTHDVGGFLFMFLGLLVAIGMVFPEYLVFFIIIPVLLVVFFVYAYSYWLYQKLPKSQKKAVYTFTVEKEVVKVPPKKRARKPPKRKRTVKRKKRTTKRKTKRKTRRKRR